MLRIHFTAQDLSRVRVVRLSPLALAQRAAGDHEARRDLVLALRELQQAAIAGTAGRIAGVLDDEQAEFGRALLSDGVGEALTRLHPLVRWEASVLHSVTPLGWSLLNGVTVGDDLPLLR
ncbi:hypothetical protein AB0B66_43630 [Catellatospora sp. NPDC049111]|uniref:hypothetical protein n=1 Tax=Catellatospora sp. NPDC049111 TaxID=3155271 RepID=UPI0033F739DD